MKLEIKNIIYKLKNIDREYILLFLVIFCVGFLIYSALCLSQGLPGERINVTTFYPSPFGEYDEIRTNIILDYDDPSFYIDPNGETRLNSLVMTYALTTPVVTDTNATPTYSINLNTGSVCLNNVSTVGVIHMGANTPAETGWDGKPIGGKHVYDVSEGMLAKDCDSGDVVLISQDKDCLLTKSSKKFDPLVAGVISEEPKLLLGIHSADYRPLALSGIVKCNATTENGPIERGDLLVSSSVPGYAMRATDNEVKPGMLIGKALQPLKKGKDKIYILMNKQ